MTAAPYAAQPIATNLSQAEAPVFSSCVSANHATQARLKKITAKSHRASRLFLNDSEHILFAHQQHFFTVQFKFIPGVSAEKDGVALFNL